MGNLLMLISTSLDKLAISSIAVSSVGHNQFAKLLHC